MIVYPSLQRTHNCRQSLEDKTCSYKECRFFHLTGTKSTYNPKSKLAQQKPKSYTGPKSIPTKNKFSALSENEEEEAVAADNEHKKVFQQAKPNLMDSIAEIRNKECLLNIKQLFLLYQLGNLVRL